MTTHKQNLLKKLNLPKNESYSLSELATLTNTPLEALQEIFNRGIGAWKTNISSVRLKDFSKDPDVKKFPRSTRLTKEQWAFARVYSFLDKGKTYKTADKDIAMKYKI